MLAVLNMCTTKLILSVTLISEISEIVRKNSTLNVTNVKKTQLLWTEDEYHL